MARFLTSTAFHLSTDECLRLEALGASRPSKTANDLVHQVLEIGLYHLEYRGKRNKAQSDLKKLGRAVERMVNSPKGIDPTAARALAIALGMAEAEPEDEVIAVDPE